MTGHHAAVRPGVRSRTPGGRERTCLRRKRGSAAGLLSSEMKQGSHGDLPAHTAQAGRQGVSGSGAAQTPRPEGTESHIHDFPQIILVTPAQHRWHLHAHRIVGNHRGLPSHLILFFTGMWLRFPFMCQRAGSVQLGAHTSPTMHQETRSLPRVSVPGLQSDTCPSSSCYASAQGCGRWGACAPCTE